MQVKDIRSELTSHPTKEYPQREISAINHIDIHHSASLISNYQGKSTVESFANSHVNTNNWPGLGYHYVVGPNGDVFKTGYASESRWSVGGNNSYTISIMLIGRLHEEEPTEVEWDNAVNLASQLANAYNVPVENIKGHREYPNQATLCPGIDMNEFRKAVNKKLI